MEPVLGKQTNWDELRTDRDRNRMLNHRSRRKTGFLWGLKLAGITLVSIFSSSTQKGVCELRRKSAKGLRSSPSLPAFEMPLGVSTKSSTESKKHVSESNVGSTSLKRCESLIKCLLVLKAGGAGEPWLLRCFHH